LHEVAAFVAANMEAAMRNLVNTRLNCMARVVWELYLNGRGRCMRRGIYTSWE
jgi:hypothetical protein